ncbi:MAG: hypothetical protein QOC65_1372 [Sphingomonadales bacterium]|nr:hypothetical protein [Sphingomonadales bacterium]
MSEGKGHPLPASGEARHDEIPERLEEEKGRGQDPAEITTPHPEGVNPDGESYRFGSPGGKSHEPEPGP